MGTLHLLLLQVCTNSAGCIAFGADNDLSFEGVRCQLSNKGVVTELRAAWPEQARQETGVAKSPSYISWRFSADSRNQPACSRSLEKE